MQREDLGLRRYPISPCVGEFFLSFFLLPFLLLESLDISLRVGTKIQVVNENQDISKDKAWICLYPIFSRFIQS